MNKTTSLARPRVLRTLSLGLGVLLASSAVACVSESEIDDPVTEQSQALDADAPSEGERPHPRGPHGERHLRRGPHALIHVALDELQLTDEQRRTLEAERDGLREGMKRDHHPKDFEEKAASLASAVRAGAVDPAALGIDAGAHDARVKAGHARVVAAIDTLHDTLSAEQRVELVSILKERHEARTAKRSQWRGRRGARADRPDGERAGPRRGDDREARARRGRRGPGGPLGFMLRGLDVTEEQRAAIDAGLEEAGLKPDREARKERFSAMKERHEAMLEAFVGESFDAASALPPPPQELARGPQRMVETLAVIVPLLDEAQREELALRIEQGPKMMRGKRGHAGERGHDRGRRGGPERRR